MLSPNKIGIIDIGSNSVRLVIYESSQTAYRVIDESKKSARLSERITQDGRLPDPAIDELAETLAHFKRLCRSNGASAVRAVATAAIRNAANAEDIIRRLRLLTDLPVEILSGEDEARHGFIGTINTVDVRDSMLIDIGGGSTEVSLFRGRRLAKSVSFPFGAVNTAKRFSPGGKIDEAVLRQIRAMVTTALEREPWLRENDGRELLGLGGTIRTLGKLIQFKRNYSLALTHNFQMDEQTVDEVLVRLSGMSLSERQALDGLAKDRADIIVPGLAILQTVFRHTGSSGYRISGAGLHDGLFYETRRPLQPIEDEVLEASVRNLLSLHPSVPQSHVEQVDRIGLRLFEDLSSVHELDERCRVYMHVSALLYRIGITVNYYQYPKHTFYLMAHSRIDGLSHREILLCAMIASFKSKSRTRKAGLLHKDILSESDLQLAVKLGMLLRLAIALDRSETQPIAGVEAKPGGGKLDLNLLYRGDASIEETEVRSIERDFKKIWGLALRCRMTDASKP